MAPSPLEQQRTHNTLLFKKLLDLKPGASPFTLLLDNLDQRSDSVVKEFVRRAKWYRTKIIFVSFVTLRKRVPFEPEVFISARSNPLGNLRDEILSHMPPTPPGDSSTKTLIIIDLLNPLFTTHRHHVPTFLSSLLTTPSTSLLSTYHLDTSSPSTNPLYSPNPITTLTYLSTSILTLTPLSQILARKRFKDKSLVEPTFDLYSLPEGVLSSLKPAKNPGVDGEPGALVIRAELRRKSGRSIIDSFVLTPPQKSSTLSKSTTQTPPQILLLADHPLYTPTPSLTSPTTTNNDEDGEVETTFNLNLTAKQKRDRENVVLPYFDAQKEGGSRGAGEGGRILYDMGAEDREDFDDEEDEI